MLADDSEEHLAATGRRAAMWRGAPHVPPGCIHRLHSAKSVRMWPGASEPQHSPRCRCGSEDARVGAFAVAVPSSCQAPAPVLRAGRGCGCPPAALPEEMGCRRGNGAAVSWGKPHQGAASPPRFPEKNPMRVSFLPSSKPPSIIALAAHRPPRAARSLCSLGQPAWDRAQPGGSSEHL